MTLGRPTLGRWDPDPMNICPASDTEKVDETASLSTTPRILHHRNQSSTPLRPTPTNHHSRNASIRLLSPPLVRNASPPPLSTTYRPSHHAFSPPNASCETGTTISDSLSTDPCSTATLIAPSRLLPCNRTSRPLFKNTGLLLVRP
jgi:hypothetical protein